MTVKLNSFTLPDKVIDIMKEKLRKSEETKREFGFNLCKIDDTDELKDDVHCIGSECNIRLYETCKIGKKVGLFHTHPINGGSGATKMSLSDMQNGYFYGITCIAGVEDKKIKCFVRKNDFNQEDYELIIYNRQRHESKTRKHQIKTRKGYEIVLAKMREAEHARQNLENNFFNVVNIKE